jgi:hypothetical protein
MCCRRDDETAGVEFGLLEDPDTQEQAGSVQN